MKQVNIFFVSIIFYLVVKASAECDIGWHSYEDSNCYKVIDVLVNKDDAGIICRQEDPEASSAVLSINNPGEQSFISSLVFDELEIYDSVWLSATRHNGSTFVWPGGSRVIFANWEAGHPTDNPTFACVQLTSAAGLSKVEAGGWRDVPCTKRNIPVCRKDPKLSLREIQKQVAFMKANPIPIGFLYTQYPGKVGPTTIWPGVVWKDVTVEYAGLFFRAAGGSSAPFGELQEDNSNRVVSVQYIGSQTSGTLPANISLPIGTSGNIKTGVYKVLDYDRETGISFELNQGEIRPKNTAVKIWERIA